jgi:pimeloyl-ACP methyl ester carboxylesterase
MTARTGGWRRRGAWTLMVALVLAAGCGDGSRERPAPATGAAQPTPATTAGEIRATPCLEAGEAARLFQLTTGDAATLVGLTLGRGRTGLVLGHQRSSDLCEWLPQARRFARLGYQVLVFDFAGFGDSRAGPDSRVDTDVVAATAELRRRGVDRVVLVGSSMGGTAVLSAATRIRPPVAGVVSLSGPSGFGGVDAQGAMGRLRVPVLFVVGANDPPFTEQARLLYRAARVGDKRLLVVPGGGHGTSLVEFGEDAPRVLAAVRRFIAEQTRH